MHKFEEEDKTGELNINTEEIDKDCFKVTLKKMTFAYAARKNNIIDGQLILLFAVLFYSMKISKTICN